MEAELKNVIYINERLEAQLDKIKNYSITIFDAPTGFGKTTALKEYSHRTTYKFMWINISTTSKDIFWADFCETIGKINDEAGRELHIAEYPKDGKGVAQIRTIIKNLEISEPTFIAMDNYNMICDAYTEMLMSSLVDALPEDLHFIYVTQGVPSTISYELVNRQLVHYISKPDLEFKSEDVKTYFKEYGITISDSEAEQLYEFSEGWISAIHLQMLGYMQRGGLDIGSSMETLVHNNIWSKLDKNKRKLLIMLSRLDHFTIKEARLAAPEEEEAWLEKFLNNVVFIRFDKSNRNYYVHNIFISYLENEFHLLPEEVSNDIAVRCGKVYEHRGDMIKAYGEYYKTGQWECIYKSMPTFDMLYPCINTENKEFFLTLINKCPYEIKEKYPYFRMVMCLVLFMYKENEKIAYQLEDIECSIKENNTISERQKKGFYAMLHLVKGYTSFNDIDTMKEEYELAGSFGNIPVIDITYRVPFTFGSPSMIHIFHREPGMLEEETHRLESMMPCYYKLSEGHGKGAEALYKAETLYNMADIQGAETLCHKALYMADSREQTCIMTGVLLLLAKISIFDGDYDNFMEKKEAIKSKITYNFNKMDIEYINMVELAESYLYSLMGEADKIVLWLTDYSDIEKKMNLINMGYANIIYGKYLYLKGEHKKFLGISGQFLGVASLFSSVMAQIYTYILISMSNLASGNSEKAISILDEAIKLAYTDMLVMPFVENYEYIEQIFEEINFNSEYRAFMKKVRSVAKNYNTGLKGIRKNSHNKDNYGLTARECDIAKLAAARLSNKEIAEQLFIAESTVKSNLKSIFSKLNITSRTELSSFFK